MTTFYICRHGETENNKNRLLSGWIDTPLTKEGVNNAYSSAKKLNGVHIDKIISSDLGRALSSAKIIAEAIGFNNHIDTFKELREVNYGQLSNTQIANYPKMTALQNTDFVPEGGESLSQMAKRVTNFFLSYSGSNSAKTTLIVGHDGTIKALYAMFYNRNIGLVDADMTLAHDAVIKFVFDGNRIISWEEL